MSNGWTLKQAKQYAAEHHQKLGEFLGGGQDGDVWRLSRGTAVKVFHRTENYRREYAAYVRLGRHKVTSIEGLAVPTWIARRDDLQALEMTYVVPPFVLDFGKSYVDERPPYIGNRPIMEEFWAGSMAMFTPEEWFVVERVYCALDRIGIWHGDPNPRNFTFEPLTGAEAGG